MEYKKSRFTMDPRLYQLHYLSTQYIIEPVANCRLVAPQTRKRQRVIFFRMFLSKNNDGKKVLFPVITSSTSYWYDVVRNSATQECQGQSTSCIKYNNIICYYHDGRSDVQSGGWKTATADIMIIDHHVSIAVKTFGVFFFNVYFTLPTPPHQCHYTIFAFTRTYGFWRSNIVAPDPFTVY